MQGIQKDQTAGNHCEQRGNGTRNVTSVYKSRSNEVYENEVQDIGGQEAKPQFIVSRKVTERRYKGQKQQLLADSDREAFRIEKCAEWDEAYPNKSFLGASLFFHGMARMISSISWRINRSGSSHTIAFINHHLLSLRL